MTENLFNHEENEEVAEEEGNEEAREVEAKEEGKVEEEEVAQEEEVNGEEVFQEIDQHTRPPQPNSIVVSQLEIKSISELGDDFELRFEEAFSPASVSFEWMQTWDPKVGGFFIRHLDGSHSFKI